MVMLLKDIVRDAPSGERLLYKNNSNERYDLPYRSNALYNPNAPKNQAIEPVSSNVRFDPSEIYKLADKLVSAGSSCDECYDECECYTCDTCDGTSCDYSGPG